VRIGFDAKRFFENKSGLGSFSRNLIKSLITDHPQHEYFLYTPKQPSKEVIQKYLDISNVKIRYPKNENGNFWRTRGILKDLARDEIDIYHGLSNEIPFGIHKIRIKTVVTIHDLIFKEFKEDHGVMDRMIYDWKSKYACHHADKIVTISKSSQQKIMDYYGIPASEVTVVYQDIDSIFEERTTQDQQEQVLQDLNVPTEFALFVGNDSRRKNLITVIRSLTHLKEERSLVLVLNKRELNKKIKDIIRQYNLYNRITILVDISINSLKVLYTQAKCLVYPSLLEGWGLPVEEALACNTLVIVPNAYPFTEHHSDGKVLLSDTEDPVEMAERIESIWPIKKKNIQIKHKILRYSTTYHKIYENIQTVTST